MTFRSKHTDTSLSFDKFNITDLSAKSRPRKPTDQTQYSNRTSSDLPSNKPTNSTSLSSTSTSTSIPSSGSDFDRRLQFLQGFQRRSKLPSPTSTPETKKVQRRVLGKKYRHGFQRGDFMCPQCGSHNFRPPEHALIGPWTGARKSQDSVDKVALKAPSGSAKGGVSATVGENDLRLSNPREYVCASCQTINYSGRIHCVGCGTLAPWIRDMVERGI
ncbi:hypothetical protein BGZ52_003316 [Haplosporangium bisporale]|nr:hypothetical protein BGZ52_003316 [Haplosporangium bisporale]KAF9210360.1 hypothetical protein BGZ59_009532 [Podila verticillata]